MSRAELRKWERDLDRELFLAIEEHEKAGLSTTQSRSIARIVARKREIVRLQLLAIRKNQERREGKG